MIAGRFCETPLLRRTARLSKKIDKPPRKVAKIYQQICAKSCKRNLWRRQNEHHAQQQQVHQIDYDEGEKRALIGKISLIFRDHPARKREMERPRCSDHSVKPPTVRLLF